MMAQEQQDRIRALMGTPEQWLIVGHVRDDDDRHYLAFWTGFYDGIYRLYVQRSTSAGTDTHIVAQFTPGEPRADTDAGLSALPLNEWQKLQLFHCTSCYAKYDSHNLGMLIHSLQREHTPLHGQPARMFLNKYDETIAVLTEAKAAKKRESSWNRSRRLAPFEEEAKVYRDELLRRLGA